MCKVVTLCQEDNKTGETEKLGDRTHWGKYTIIDHTVLTGSTCNQWILLILEF